MPQRQYPRKGRAPRAAKPKNATAIENTRNTKLGDCAATYVNMVTCPSSCPLRGRGCYAESGWTYFLTKHLNNFDADPMTVTRDEVEAIGKLSGTKPLRLHVMGDVTTDEQASMLAAAAKDYTAKAGFGVWAYTHSWRHVTGESWGDITAFASCEAVMFPGRDRLADIRYAYDRGYVPSQVVLSHESAKVHDLGDGFKGVPCPAQTKPGVTCSTCLLCTRKEYLRSRKFVIEFSIHGLRKGKIIDMLNPTLFAPEEIEAA